MYLKADSIRYRYDGQENNLFEGVNLEISRHDKIGLIGDNGSGKTTLFKIIIKELPPDDGQLIYARKQPSIGFLRQEIVAISELTVVEEVKTVFSELLLLKSDLEAIEQQLLQNSGNQKLLEQYGELQEKFEKRDGYTIDNRVETILSALGFDPVTRELPCANLSSGQRCRLELAKLLLMQPDVLLLDEPTNHLDIPALEWLEQFLKKYPESVVIISHDRYFLDQVVTRIWEIQSRNVSTFSGNYSFYHDEQELRKRHEREEFLRKTSEIKRLKRAMADRTNKARRVAAKPKNKSKYDPFAKPFYRAKAAKLQKRASVIQRRIEKIGEVEKPPRERQSHIDFRIDRESSHFVCTAKNLNKAYGTRTLFHNIEFTLTAGQRIALVGPNGCGKTTLLKLILGEEKPDSGELHLGSNLAIGYSSQELNHLDFHASILDEVMVDAKEDQTWVRTILGCLNLEGDGVYQSIESLSLGERNKVSMAKILLSHANFLILDEPTNHLDIRTRELIENALLEYPGTILFVSHDRHFINKLADDVWNFWQDE
ncbi:ABC-F type ribosomal protection protein [candidate division KSB1 bacterium]|nr:ABC-F type ribosomal protection protein [candidate division KSB1 bacterium]